MVSSVFAIPGNTAGNNFPEVLSVLLSHFSDPYMDISIL
jgi:hypothetical protein